MLYLLPLSLVLLEQFRTAPWSRPNESGRKTVRLSTGHEIFVSLNPRCRWPGTSLQPRINGQSKDAAPDALPHEKIVAAQQATDERANRDDEYAESDADAQQQALTSVHPPNSAALAYVELARPENYVSFWKTILSSQLAIAKEHGVNTASDLNAYAAKKCFNEPLWKLTELNGKYWCRYISVGVWQAAEARKRLPNQYGVWPNDDTAPRCQHEHVVERQHLLWQLVAGKLKLEELDKFLIACVVTPEEHLELGSVPVDTPLDPENVWRRYQEARVQVWDRKDQQLVVL